jgi:hypothetical protein
MSGPERGPSGPEGTPFEDRIAEALRSVSSQMDVPPRAFHPPAPCRHRGRYVDPVRSPLRWVAVAAMVVGVAGLLALTPSSINNDLVVTDTSEDADSPVSYEAPPGGSVDPLFLDYVAPIDGDAHRLAEGVFDTGLAWSTSPTITDCVERRGLLAAEAPWAVSTADWYAANGSPAGSDLPALQAIAEGGVDRPPPDRAPPHLREAVESCRRADKSTASRWKRDLEPLQAQFAGTVARAVAAVESGPVWPLVQGCLTEFGVPTTGAPGIGGYVDRLAVEQPAGPSTALDRSRPTGAEDDDDERAKDFATCATHFYTAVERELVGPRATFVEKYRNELVELQTEFADFA